MNVLILNGAPRDSRGDFCRKIAAAAVRESRAKGHAVTAFDLDGLAIKPCRGCFACWIKHPGTCAIEDDEALVLRAAATSDVQVWTTPVTFGGYGPALKKALDRAIPNILPFFTKIHGEVHHPQRYDRRRSFLVLGTLTGPDAEAERIFHNVVRRNAINLGSTMTEFRVLYEGAAESDVDGQIKALVDAILEAR
jgi:multimeric flavodoxin WrbA